MKYKPNSVRTYDSDGLKRRSGCLIFKDETEQEVLLVSGSHDPGRWVVPGGGIEPTEDTQAAALRECEEEAGVKGKMGRCLGVFENVERKTRTSVYVMVVTEHLEDWEDARSIGRRRKWFSLSEAMAQLILHKPTQHAYIVTLLDQHKQHNNKVS